MALTTGQTFAGYRIVRRLGCGGMGEVYLAEHPRLPRRDALKIMPEEVSADADYRARFLREADLASRLYHPHIVGVHDRGEYDDQLWISMDYVDGVDAKQLLSRQHRNGMPVDDVRRIVSALAGALDYAHKQGLLHRDVKPDNIMLTHLDDDAGERRILLTDFGIARNLDEISGLTATNFTVGTVAYAAPEQLMGKPLTGRADQYALAATAYQLLSGSQLFPHSNGAVIISHHLNAAPPPLADSHPSLATLDPVLTRALAKEPSDRFATCLEFARALSDPAIASEAATASAATQLAHTVRAAASTSAPADRHRGPSALSKAARNPWIPAAAVTLVVLVALGGVLIWRPWQKSEPTRTTTLAAPPAAVSTAPQQVLPSPPPPPAPPPPPIFQADAIDSVLLTAAEVTALTGSTGPPLQANNLSYGAHWTSVQPPSCGTVMYGANHVDDSSAVATARRDQQLNRSSVIQGDGPANVDESVSVFPSAADAAAVFNSTRPQWQSCAASGVKVGAGEDHWTFTLSDVQFRGDLASVSMVANETVMVGARSCQAAIGLRTNVIVEAWTCQWKSYQTGDYAEQLVTSMLNRVKT